MTLSEPTSCADLVAGMRSGTLDPQAVMVGLLRRINAHHSLNAFLWVQSLAAGPSSGAPVDVGKPLAGLPIALKDNIDTAGIPTTSGSLVDRGRIPTVDAEVWQRLRDIGGAQLIGKSHMCEYGYRFHHPALGWVRNPHDLTRIAGGSSSGSAAAVAAGIAPAAIGTDTSGSIRIPAAYCGVVGLKGTLGRVSSVGVVPLSPTLDHVGVLTRSVADAALVYEQMSVRPVQLVDPVSLSVQPADPRHLRVGVLRIDRLRGVQPAVVESAQRAMSTLLRMGTRLVDVDLRDAPRWRTAHSAIVLHEAWEQHAMRLSSSSRHGSAFRRAVSNGATVTSDDVARAHAVRRSAIRSVASIFDAVDVLLTPTCPTVAPRHETHRAGPYTRFTALAAFTGIPAITIPAGVDGGLMPIGLQLMAAADREEVLISAASLLEGAIEADWPAGRLPTVRGAQP